MKFTLKPGAELDLLTQDELEETLKRVRDEAVSGYSRPATDYRDFQATRLDGNGNSGIPGAANNPNTVALFEIKQGYSLRLHRLAIQAEGSTFATTYTGGYIYLYRAGRFIDFANLALGLPVVFSYTSDAPIYNNGETVDILVSAGPKNTNLICDIQGTWEALPGTLVFN
jgi:hypothetical protein